MKKALFLLILFTLSLIILPAGADGITGLWVTGTAGIAADETGKGPLPADAIRWYGSGNEYYLFLPGYADLDAMRVWFEGAQYVLVGKQVIKNGDSAGFLNIEGVLTLHSGKAKYSLTIMRGSKLPAVFITTGSGSLDLVNKSKENKETGSMVLADKDGAIGYNGALAYIKMHGNSSTTFKKKNYQVKLETGTDLLSMGKSRTWLLIGNSRDKSLLRNQIALDMAAYAGIAYTPEHCLADVYINNTYMGCCLFSEKVQIDSDRIDIFDLEKETESINGMDPGQYERTGSLSAVKGQWKAFAVPNDPLDISGGYLVEYEAYENRYREEDSAYLTKRGNVLVVKSPEYASANQMAYISGFMQSFENAIFAADGRDPDSGKHYSEYVDMESLVLKYLLEEVVKNYDGNTSSMFFYKPLDSDSTVAFAGPPWDYDSAFGSYAQEHNKRKVLPGTGFWINSAYGKYWWPALYRHDEFSAAAAEYYRQRFKPALEVLLGLSANSTGALRSIEDYRKDIEASAAMNFIRWPMVYSTSLVARTGFTYNENIAYLTGFLQDRYAFLNAEWAATAEN